jgi:hypothetical protein
MELIDRLGKKGIMPRRARLDAPGTLHHAIVLGIDKPRITSDVSDRKDFFKHMGKPNNKGETPLSLIKTLCPNEMP